MAIEIERKFLVVDDNWRRAAVLGTAAIRQGYIADGTGVGMTVRVRLVDAHGFLTLKSPGLMARTEFEYGIPQADAEALLAHHCILPVIDKRRTRLCFGEMTWEIDEFGGHLSGLVIAEVELHAVDQHIALPPWIGAEVTGDPRFQNLALARAAGIPQHQA